MRKIVVLTHDEGQVILNALRRQAAVAAKEAAQLSPLPDESFARSVLREIYQGEADRSRRVYERFQNEWHRFVKH